MKNCSRIILGLFAVTVSMAGCAKEDLVKKDEPVVQQQTIKQPATQQQTPVTPSTTAATNASNQQNDGSGAKAATTIALETVFFDFDRSDLRQDARDTLSKNAETLMKKVADSKVKIEGNCDERGSDEYNLALGERRAKSVAAYLINLGIKPERISTISYGKEKPLVKGNNEAAWAKNRRAEFVLSK